MEPHQPMYALAPAPAIIERSDVGDFFVSTCESTVCYWPETVLGVTARYRNYAYRRPIVISKPTAEKPDKGCKSSLNRRNRKLLIKCFQVQVRIQSRFQICSRMRRVPLFRNTGYITEHSRQVRCQNEPEDRAPNENAIFALQPRCLAFLCHLCPASNETGYHSPGLAKSPANI